jgi:3-deoxy-D-manno-octulosonate 8-phosphate phosphatase (KDO 8-P phosphatase)
MYHLGGSNEGVRKIEKFGNYRYSFGHPWQSRNFKEYAELYNINPEHVLYMGDDIPDYHVMKLVGFTMSARF